MSVLFPVKHTDIVLYKLFPCYYSTILVHLSYLINWYMILWFLCERGYDLQKNNQTHLFALFICRSIELIITDVR